MASRGLVVLVEAGIVLLQRRCPCACLHLADDDETVEATHGHKSHPGVRSVTAAAAADSISLPTTRGIDFGAVANQVSFAGIRTLVLFSHLCPQRLCVKLLADFFFGHIYAQTSDSGECQKQPPAHVYLYSQGMIPPGHFKL